MPPANPYRGELRVDVGGEARRLRLTFNALVAIEQDLQGSILALAQRFSEGTFTFIDMTVLLHRSLEAGGTGMPYDAVGNALLTEGITFHVDTCVSLLKAALAGEIAHLQQAQPVGKPQASGDS